jgi:hypothetical protein
MQGVSLDTHPHPVEISPQSVPDIPQSWLHVRYRRGDADQRLLPCSLSLPVTAPQRFVCALRQMIRSLDRRISTSLSKKRDCLIVGHGVQRLSTGCLAPDERTIYRSGCIQEIRRQFPSASTVQLSLYLEGFDAGERFALRNEDKLEMGTSALSYQRGEASKDGGFRDGSESHALG